MGWETYTFSILLFLPFYKVEMTITNSWYKGLPTFFHYAWSPGKSKDTYPSLQGNSYFGSYPIATYSCKGSWDLQTSGSSGRVEICNWGRKGSACIGWPCCCSCSHCVIPSWDSGCGYRQPALYNCWITFNVTSSVFLDFNLAFKVTPHLYSARWSFILQVLCQCILLISTSNLAAPKLKTPSVRENVTFRGMKCPIASGEAQPRETVK